MELALGNRLWTFGRPRVMGVLNVTPDSFSDGGQFVEPSVAVDHAAAMVEQGADIIDVGGESTRPGAADVSLAAELDRVVPVIERLAARFETAISVDTSKPEVMREAVGAGACMINDIYALRRQGALEAAAELDVAVCLMHMQGTPGNMQDAPVYRSLPGDIIDFLETRVADCVAAGIAHRRLVVDPGFGFGKTAQHNLTILAKLDRLQVIGLPVLVGLSRKRTLGELTGRAPDQRLAAGVAAAVLALCRGAQIVRTHDVGATIDAVQVVWAAMEAEKQA